VIHIKSAYCVGIAKPLVKKVDGDKTMSDNYRCITPSPAISKLFKMVLLQIFHKQLTSLAIIPRFPIIDVSCKER